MSDGDFKNPYNTYEDLPDHLNFYHCLDPYDEEEYRMMSFWSNGNTCVSYPGRKNNLMNGRMEKFFVNGNKQFIKNLTENIEEGEAIDFVY